MRLLSLDVQAIIKRQVNNGCDSKSLQFVP